MMCGLYCAGLSPRRSGLSPRSVHLRFVADKVALGQVFLQYIGFALSVPFHQRRGEGEFLNIYMTVSFSGSDSSYAKVIRGCPQSLSSDLTCSLCSVTSLQLCVV